MYIKNGRMEDLEGCFTTNRKSKSKRDRVSTMEG